MRIFISFFTGFVTLFSGCSTISRNQSPDLLTLLPPKGEVITGKDEQSVDYFLEERLRENPSEAMEWWTRYQQGKLWSSLDRSKACDFYLGLSKSPRFPLNSIALLRGLEACPKERQDLPPLAEAAATHEEQPWLREIVFRTVHSRAILTDDREREMKLSAELARLATLQKEKVQLLNRAIELAKELKQDELIQTYSDQLGKIAPRFKQDPKPREYLRIALDFRRAREFDTARAFYRKVLNNRQLTDTDRYLALNGIRLAYKLEKRVDEYVEATKKMADLAKRKFKRARKDKKFWKKKFHDSHILLARTLWTERTVGEALKVISRLEKDLKGRYSLSEIRWLRARIAEEAGHFDRAVKILQSASSGPQLSRGLAERIEWYKNWNLRKLGRHQEAVDGLRLMNSKFAAETNSMRNRFWLAKSLQALKRQEEAAKELEELISLDPLGYYGSLAYRELDRKLPPARTPGIELDVAENESRGLAVSSSSSLASSSSPLASASMPMPESMPTPFENPNDHAYVEWLLSVGENLIARRYLDHFSKSKGKLSGDSPADRELLKYHARAGNFYTLFVRLGSFPSDIRARVLSEEPGLLFPQPYFYYVSEASRRYGVAVELIYAIMRQESSFDPLARSHADAFGLMQLIPEAAKRVEGASGITLSAPEDLYKPDVNVSLGTAFLRHLLDKSDEQFIPTVASYNASEKAIRGWLRTRFRGDPLEFIEDIPYEETRGYVKLVMRNYIFYLRLNSGGRPISFPEWCLESLHEFNS